MSLEFDSDFDGYFDALYGHGEVCTFTPQGGAAVSIKVILDQEYFEVPGESVGVNSSQPIVYGKAKDLKSGEVRRSAKFCSYKGFEREHDQSRHDLQGDRRATGQLWFDRLDAHRHHRSRDVEPGKYQCGGG